MKFSILLPLLFITSFSFSQNLTFNKTSYNGIEKLGMVNFSEIEDPFMVTLVNIEAPDVASKKQRAIREALKMEMLNLYPQKENAIPSKKASIQGPEVVNGFKGYISTSLGVPLDNNLAANQSQVLSAMNSTVVVKSLEGTDLKEFTLNQISTQVGLTGNTFDPKLIYDYESSRYILVFLHGNYSNQTNIIIAFSQSDDALGDWSVYELPGNPNESNNWTDYPIISVNQTDLIITGNLVEDEKNWDDGFVKSIIWQVDKQKGYTGEPLESFIWQDIKYDDTYVWNLCAMESGDDILETNTYFLSNKNYSLESDSIFILELTGGILDANTTLEVDVLQSNNAYGLPPNAEQSLGKLQTNDARVLEGFYQDDEIQFVGNTRNMDNNKAGIYHGHIRNVSSDKSVTLEHVIGEDFEVGYPGISYTGNGIGEVESIISFGHVSKTKHAGVSAVYYVPEYGYSDIVTVKEGSGFIKIINGSVQRWGDYAGSQRDVSNDGSCWISGFYGVSSHFNLPWVAHLAPPADPLSTQSISDAKSALTLYPNPVKERFNLNIDIPSKAKSIQINLVSNDGKVVSLLETQLFKKGENDFSFNITNLTTGIYHVRVLVDGVDFVVEQLVVD